MRITLIQPSMGKIPNEKYARSWSMYPLNLAVIAGLTPKDTEINFIDDRFDKINYDSSDLVAIPVETYTAKRAYSIADNFRSKNIPVVLGGMHTTLLPEETSLHSDSIVIGDCENVWVNLLNDLKNNSLKPRYSSKLTGNLPYIQSNRKIFDMNNYLPVELIETGRGCPFSCDFCAISATYNGSYRVKSVDEIINEVGSVERKNIYFVDDNFVSDFSRTKKLCEALTPLGIRWISQGSINMAQDSHLLTDLQKSGCLNMLIGFESLNPKALELMGKSWASSKKNYTESIKKIRDNGLTIYATFVFGYDTDTKDDFKRTLDFAIEQKFAITAFNHLVPFPGTKVYKRLEKEKRLLFNNWWLRDNGKFGEVVFKPKNMSPEELAEGCFNCREEFYKFSSIAKRLFDFKANSRNFTNFGYLSWINLFSRYEAKKRQGWPIGDCENVTI